MTEVKEDSTVKVHYTGSLPNQDDQIFDTSKEEVAKEKGIYNEQRDYGPLEVPMGEKKVIPGFESALLGMEKGESKTVEIPPEKAYGEKNPENVVTVPDDQFTENNIEPQVGGMIQTNNGVAQITAYDKNENQVTLDFNHPLAGKTLKFELEVVDVE